ncbi:MAG: DinB family protein [Longimicrobiales bacterium]
MNTEPLPPELAALRAAFEAQTEAATALVDGLTERQFAWRPSEGAWSVAECIDHLTRSAELYMPAFDRALARAPTATPGDRRAYRPSLLGRLMVYSIAPPYRIRTRTLAPIEPGTVLERETALRAFERAQRELVRRVEAGAGRDLGRTRMASALSPRLVLNIFDWMRFLEAHERRHLWQASRLSLAPGWPR